MPEVGEHASVIKRMAFIKAKAGLSREEFRDYYETVHAPLGLRLFPMFKQYRRNYLTVPVRQPEGSAAFGYDAINEICFANEEDYRAYLELAARPDIRAQILADEANFIESNTLWGFVVEEAESNIDSRPFREK